MRHAPQRSRFVDSVTRKLENGYSMGEAMRTRSWMAPAAALLLLAGCLDDDATNDTLGTPAIDMADAGALLETATIETTGVFTAAVENLAFSECGQIPGGAASMHEHAWILGENFTDAVVTNLTATLTSHMMSSAGANADSDLFLLDPSGNEIAAANGFNVLVGETDSIVVPGPLPVGTYTLRVLGCTAVNGEWSLSGEAEIRNPMPEIEEWPEDA